MCTRGVPGPSRGVPRACPGPPALRVAWGGPGGVAGGSRGDPLGRWRSGHSPARRWPWAGGGYPPGPPRPLRGGKLAGSHRSPPRALGRRGNPSRNHPSPCGGVSSQARIAPRPRTPPVPPTRPPSYDDAGVRIDNAPQVGGARTPPGHAYRRVRKRGSGGDRRERPPAARGTRGSSEEGATRALQGPLSLRMGSVAAGAWSPPRPKVAPGDGSRVPLSTVSGQGPPTPPSGLDPRGASGGGGVPPCGRPQNPRLRRPPEDQAQRGVWGAPAH